MRRVNLPEDIEGPKDEFFTHQLVDLILAQAGTHLTTNWHCFSEPKHEGLYTKLREATNVLVSKGAKGYFWLVMPPDINELLETSFPKKYVAVPMDQLPLGYDCVLYTGTFDKRWRMYIDPLLTNTIVVGATFSKKNPNFYATIKLEDYGVARETVKDKIAEAKSLMEGFFPE
jgi:hypothetical protein